jgi:hypothetical protein
MDINTILVDRIEERLQALGLSDRKASLKATGRPDLIRDIRRGKVPLSDKMGALARALETTADYLQGHSDAASDGRVPKLVPPDMPRDIPVYGTAIGADADFWSEHSGDIAIEQTDLNTGEVIDYFRRPPSLMDRRDVYGLYVAGDSMAPRFESGEGVVVDPKQPPAIRDDVVVYLRASSGDGAAAVLIQRLVRRSSEWIELEQFNPPSVFRIDKRKVAAIHRVKPLGETLGM